MNSDDEPEESLEEIIDEYNYQPGTGSSDIIELKGSERKMQPFLHQTLKTKLISKRVLDLYNGAQPTFDVSELKAKTVHAIAAEELRRMKLPLKIIVRHQTVPPQIEVWDISELQT